MITADEGARWTIVHDKPDERVRRYPVPGGWLYQVEKNETSIASADGWSTAHVGWYPPVFVPDPDAVRR